jgi:hypothetical protein
MSKSLPGIAKRRLTGNQRQKLREAQASMLGTSADDLLKQRRHRMEEWQREQAAFVGIRCPNCGICGHPWRWCPFSSDFFSQKDNITRFRGPFGTWETESSLVLTQEESRRMRQFFGLLCMPLGFKS